LRRENDEPVRDATKALVRSLGYNNASTFASADEFLKSEQVHDTSCLITDVQMPGLSGLDLQDHLIARGHRIPIIFMTGYSDEAIQSGPLYRVYRESFEGYLTLNRVGKTV
jgi:FixJ family two-component response regulator